MYGSQYVCTCTVNRTCTHNIQPKPFYFVFDLTFLLFTIHTRVFIFRPNVGSPVKQRRRKSPSRFPICSKISAKEAKDIFCRMLRRGPLRSKKSLFRRSIENLHMPRCSLFESAARCSLSNT